MIYSGLRIYSGDDEVTRRWKGRAVADLLRLRAAIRADDPSSTSRMPGTDPSRIRIATWNLREFDSPTYGFRLPEAFYYIAEVISAFDLVAVQEVRGDLRALERLLQILGPGWKSLMTDADESDASHNERMVFLFNTARVRFLGTAGELTLSDSDRLFLPDSFDLVIPDGVEIELPPGTDLAPPQRIPTERQDDGSYTVKPAALVPLPKGTRLVLPEGTQLAFKGSPEELAFDIQNGRIANKRLELGTGAIRRFSPPVRVRWPSARMELASQQFARTPFIVYFQAEWMKIALCTVHIYFGDNADDSPQMERRKAEIAALTKALARKAQEKSDSDADSFFIALGDFNIKSAGHGTMQALVQNGFEIPEAIRRIPEGSNVKRDMFYDQIALWMGKDGFGAGRGAHTRIDVTDAGIFDIFNHVYREGDDDAGSADETYFRQRMNDVKRSYVDYRGWRTHQISDHLPMWVELRTDFADDYLKRLAAPADPDNG